ncbi:MAG: hypothetical protein GTN76_03675 [Candidatus Aenigmarchaeota archaeon]|nr:hypothetical protein [Candidatus Aenigmarchaeota archaeon]
MKKVFIVLAAVSLCGCTTFGNFANFEKGETTKEEVRSMLGEPKDKLFEKDGEVWKYHFVKTGREEEGGMQTIMNLGVTFKEDVVDNYTVTVSKESVKEEVLPIKEPAPPAEGSFPPSFRPRGTFIERFDKNNDSLVSREEFTGPSHLFDRFDTNRDGYIDESEAPRGRPKRMQSPRGKGGF